MWSAYCRVQQPLPRPIIVYQMVLRTAWSLVLLVVSLPGLLLWLPVFATTFITIHQFKRTGPVWDTYNEIV
ncbi:hypothetical protein V8D89_010005 [Ganoderma adspersum]